MKKYLVLSLLIIATAAGLWWWFSRSTDLQFSHSEISATPARIESIREIGEWEFLSVYDEEIIDTVATLKRIWPLPPKKKELARIYKGTLRLGFNLKEDTDSTWLSASGDTARVSLPKIRLLDRRFIDEAATDALIEDGDWSHADRDALYRKAAAKMEKNCLTEENFRQAESSARSQMEQLLHTLGYSTVVFE